MIAALLLNALFAGTIAVAAQPQPSASPSAAPTPADSTSPEPSASPEESPSASAAPSTSPSPSPNEGNGLPGNFTMPANWTAQPITSLMPRAMVAAWLSPHPAVSGFRQNVNILRVDNFPGTIDDYIKGANAELKAASATVTHEGPNPKCPPGTSAVTESTQTVMGHHVNVLQDAILQDHTIFLLTYIRAVSDPADPAGAAAIAKFCPTAPVV